jgi:FkbM family methyltransferase
MSFDISRAIHPKLNNGQLTDVRHCFSDSYLQLQLYEIFTRDQYNPHIDRKDLIVVDIGANIGMASLYFKDIAKHVYAIEPNPDCYECLKANTRAYKNISCFNLGISVRDHVKQYLVAHEGQDMTNTFSVNKNVSMQTAVEVVTFGTFLKENKIKKVDVLKIDCEGWEYVIFSEDSFIKNAHKIDTIVGESHYMDILRPQYIPVILGKLGFETKFKTDYPNLTSKITVTCDMIKKDYEVTEPTIFIAKYGSR